MCSSIYMCEKQRESLWKRVCVCVCVHACDHLCVRVCAFASSHTGARVIVRVHECVCIDICERAPAHRSAFLLTSVHAKLNMCSSMLASMHVCTKAGIKRLQRHGKAREHRLTRRQTDKNTTRAQGVRRYVSGALSLCQSR